MASPMQYEFKKKRKKIKGKRMLLGKEIIREEK